jgi:hypothetical protein
MGAFRKFHGKELDLNGCNVSEFEALLLLIYCRSYVYALKPAAAASIA